MTVKRIVLIRPGETDWNRAGALAGMGQHAAQRTGQAAGAGAGELRPPHRHGRALYQRPEARAGNAAMPGASSSAFSRSPMRACASAASACGRA